MKIAKTLLILTSFIFVFGSLSEAQTTKKKSKSRQSIQLKLFDERGCPLISYSKIGNRIVTAHYWCAPEVTNLNLSRTEIYFGCESKEQSCPDAKQVIDISVDATDPNNYGLVYLYSISGGKIVGTGSKVVWDLSDVKEGTYKITAAVDDGCGVCGKTITKEVKVIECADCK